jgi:hypothetical protein
MVTVLPYMLENSNNVGYFTHYRKMNEKTAVQSSPFNRPLRPEEEAEIYLYSFFNLSTRWGSLWSLPHPG